MAQISVGDPHGLYKVYVGLVDSSGYNYGQAGTGVANGTLISPYQIKQAKNATMPVPDRTVIDFTGGDVWTGAYVYGFTSLGQGDLDTATIDADLIALVGGSAADNTTNTRTMMFAENVNKSIPPQVFVMVVFRIQSKEAGSVGADKFLTIVAPRCWVMPKGIEGAPSFQAGGTYKYQIVPTMADRLPWGMLFSATGMDLTDDITPMMYLITDYPVHLVGQKTTAAASVNVTLPFKPSPAGYNYATPDSATDPVQVFVNGVITDATSVTEATGVVVVPNAGSLAGIYVGILYETEFVATA